MELNFYPMFSYQKLVTMGEIYYSNKATAFQAKRYEDIRAGLLDDLRQLDPNAKDSGTACYLHAAITAMIDHIERDNQRLNDQARANMQTAHNQLKNWK